MRKQPDWVVAIWREKGWDQMAGEELPKPSGRMSLKEKGALLLRYVAVGRSTRGVSFHTPYLRRPAFRRANLQEANLQGAYLQQTNLKGADLQQTDLHEANLQEANLQGAYLQQTNLKGADLKGADLHEANLQGADLQQTDLQQTNLKGADLKGADLHEANLQEADLKGADLKGAYLQGANLKGADLKGADLQRADLHQTDLQGADLKGADLQRADLKGARYDSLTQWPEGFEYRTSGAIGPQADLQEADLKGADLKGADLKGANLQWADLQGADLQGADLQDADFRGSFYDSNTKWPTTFNHKKAGATQDKLMLSGINFEDVTFKGRDLSYCDFRESILNGATFQLTSLHRAKFRGCHMKKTTLKGAHLRGTDFIKADLSEADLNGTDLSEATLREATFVGTQMQEADLTMVDAAKANFSGADLTDADLRHANLSETQFLGTNLTRAKLYQANLSQARMDSVDLTDADLSHANLNDARLCGVRGTPKSCTQATLTAKTYYRSEWNPAILTQWLRMGAIFPQMEFLRLHDDVQQAILRKREGLTLYFSRPLSRVDRFIIEGIIVGAQRPLGRETDCKVVEYVDQNKSSFVRLQATHPEDLTVIAKLLHEDLQQPRQQAPQPGFSLRPDGDRYRLTLRFRERLGRASRLLIEGLLSNPSKWLGRKVDVKAELNLQEDKPNLTLWASRAEDLEALEDFLTDSLDELGPVKDATMLPVFGFIDSDLYKQVHEVAQAVLPERSELWVKQQNGKVERQDLSTLLNQLGPGYRIIIEKKPPEGINIENSTVTGSVIRDGAQGHHSSRTGDGNIQLGEGAVYIGRDATDLKGVGQGNTTDKD